VNEIEHFQLKPISYFIK